MKNILLILLSGLVLCGCSKKHAVSARPPSELVEAGRDVAWSDGYVLYVGRRDGSSLEDVRVVHKGATGKIATITANKATIKPGYGSVEDVSGRIITTNAMMIILYDAQLQGVTTQAIKEYPLVLYQ